MNIKIRKIIVGVISLIFLSAQVNAQDGINKHTLCLSSTLNYVISKSESKGLIIPSVNTVSAPYEDDWATISALLDESSSTYYKTWDDTTCRTLHGGAYLGNGDFGVHLGGTKHILKYYLGKNGFHAGNDVTGFSDGLCATPGRWNQHILNLAILTIEKSSGTESGSAYCVTQDIKNAEIRATCNMGGLDVQTKTYLAPWDNTMVLELSTRSGKNVPLQATLSVVGNQYVAKNAGHNNKVAWVTKDPNPEEAPFYVNGAVAAKVLGTDNRLSANDSTWSRLTFSLPANGQTVKIYIRAEHTKNAQSPLAEIQEEVGNITEEGISKIYTENKDWWKSFWLRSFISIDDDIQKYWYNHLFLMGSAARSGSDNSPGKAPGHWGPWNRDDDMMWFSNISMNYNGQNPYYGTFSSNHVSLIDPYIETVRYYLENTGRKRVANRWVSPTIEAHMPPGCRGVAFELSFTSHGTSCGGGSWVNQDGSMPTAAVFGILPFVWKWKYGQDIGYLADICYPAMLEVADFYDDYIGEPDEHGQYNVYGAVHEGDRYFAKNDMFSLGAIRFLYREIIAASEKLGRDAVRRAHWQDIMDNMCRYPLQEWGNTITFRPDWVNDVMFALSYQGGARNTGLMFTTTFDNISYHTLPAYKIATCNTLDKGNMFYPQRFNGWQSSNDFGMMFVMAIRAGYRPDLVMSAVKGWKPELNGIVSQKRGGGIETAGIVEAINNILLQSHDGVIRIFPNWDRTKDAQFKRLRAVGAFLVEAQYKTSRQEVDSVFIHSEKGNVCKVQSPWEDSCINVTRTSNGQSVATVQNEEEFTFKTTAGVTYQITRAKCPSVPVGSPVITMHPVNTTVMLPGEATFSISASGEGLRFQWQKNRIDIPGAISPIFTTPATTMWDIGSKYRCLVSNSYGMVKSRPGILNPGSAKYLGPKRENS